VKPLFFVFLFLGWCAAAFSQAGTLSGSVLDAASQTPLEQATVSLYGPDSSLMAYRLSDKKGGFHFGRLPLNQRLRLSITYAGYLEFQKFILLAEKQADTLTVFLELNLKDSSAVVVTSVTPIRMNGDTLEINPVAFKMKEHAVVEELLNQVDGITIWSDGTITVNGKPVKSLLVDGKPFMGTNDPRIATQNLPKAAIEKIQLYQEYDRTQIGRDRQPQDSSLTMNLKLKEESKKGYFGKAAAGFGTDARYEADLSFQVYSPKSSAGIGGGLNNINKSIGNLQELFQNHTYRNFNPNMHFVGRFGESGINRNHSIGGVYTRNFIQNTNSRQNNQVTVNYNLAGSVHDRTDLLLQNRTAVLQPQYISDESIMSNRSLRHTLGVNYVRTHSYEDNFSLNGSVNTGQGTGGSTRLTEVRDGDGALQSQNEMRMLSSHTSRGGHMNMHMAGSSREDPLKVYNLMAYGGSNQSRSDRSVQSAFTSFTDPANSTRYNRR
jgi:hypothetical protein